MTQNVCVGSSDAPRLHVCGQRAQEEKYGIMEGKLSNISRFCWMRQDAGRIHCMQRDRAAEGRKEEKVGLKDGCIASKRRKTWLHR